MSYYSRDIHGNVHTRTKACDRLACVPVEHTCEAYAWAFDDCPVPWTHAPSHADSAESHRAGTEAIKPSELLIVNEQLVRDVQKIVDDLGDTIETGRSKYDALRLILDKMEKGFRIP